LEKKEIKIYTDGSCHSQLLIGAWGAIIFIRDKKIVLKGSEHETTHNRMELIAVIKAIKHIDLLGLEAEKIFIYSDSQYVVNLTGRKERLKRNNFITKKGTAIQNVDLITIFIRQIETHDLEFVKVKAHQKNGDEINREVDILVRHMVRQKVSENGN
jgi:ribonuclease HI